MSTFESNKFQTAWLGISFVSLEQWAVPEALGMPNTLESAFLGWSLLLLCSGNPNYSFCFCLNFVPPSEYHALPWGEKNLTHMSWISSVGQTQRKDRFLPSQSFLSSEVGDKSEVSQPVLYHFRWWCPDEKSVARRRVWFLLFPMWPRRSREKESWTTQTARYLCVLSLAYCVSGAFWAEWNRERLKCCFICCCICVGRWYVSYCLITMTHCLTVGKVTVVAVCPWYDLCSSW